jgi:hypothetical protein
MLIFRLTVEDRSARVNAALVQLPPIGVLIAFKDRALMKSHEFYSRAEERSV